MPPPQPQPQTHQELIAETIQQTLRIIAYVLAVCALLSVVAVLILRPSAPTWYTLFCSVVSLFILCFALLLHKRPPPISWNTPISYALLLISLAIPIASNIGLGHPHGTSTIIVIAATIGTSFLQLPHLIAALLIVSACWIALLPNLFVEPSFAFLCSIGLAIAISSIRIRTINHFTDLQTHNSHTQNLLQEAITLAQQREQQLLYQTQHDDLTNLPNRRSFSAHLQNSLDAYQNNPEQHHFAVLFIDLDRFKYVNDSFGHPAGDQLLQDISQRLLSCIPPEALLARLSGDEFAIILPTHTTSPDTLSQNIHNALRTPFNIDDNEIFSSVSIGIAPAKAGYTHPDQILRDSDIAMYRAKTQGKAQRQLFSTDMHNTLVKDVVFAMQLQKAAVASAFTLSLEPILHNDNPTGFQAQLTWKHPTRGPITSDEFITIAHEFGFSSKIQLQTLEAATLWLHETHPNSELTIHTNLSHALLQQHNTLHTLLTLCQRHSIQHQRIVLSIDEPALYELIERDLPLLETLNSYDFPICIHNFGLKYTALNLLPLPFITHIAVHPNLLQHQHTHILSLLNTLARTHNLHISATNISTPQHQHALQHLSPHSLHGPLIHPTIHTQRSP